MSSMRQQHGGELIGAYVLGALDGQEARALEEHLASCVQCREEVAELRSIETALGEVPPEAFLDGPPEGGDLMLQRTLRQVRAERGAARNRRRVYAGLAAAAVAAAVFYGGFLLGDDSSAGSGIAGPGETVSPEAVTLAATDPVTSAGLQVTLDPVADWVLVSAVTENLPPGELCRLVVLGKDGSREVAGSWVVGKPPPGAKKPSLDGFAAIPLENVAAVAVENDQGHTFVTASS
ncbi:anti-sigma factor family protein [Streptomyces aidingensis]|uniref:Putative zinc-finger n=1 Tax=Streptomyces aidingensis TaxID=910347 RepID=A0A1I1HBU0_9ACTN|nr:zf-HC2 domain-containing protein [Streptomyces aidingensis]SFC21629.1 Putative zinc-finger [Streptomyces aidingensis]